MGTPFITVYNRFLNQITDDMYFEMTAEDTVKDLRNLLIEALPKFEFPRQVLTDYTIEEKWIQEDEMQSGDIILGVSWEDIPDATPEVPMVLIEHSYFAATLQSDEINILAGLMKVEWLSRQIASVEYTRMKYSGSDFKFTSQANHLSKLLTLLETSKTEVFHAQRLYKRRKIDDQGRITSNWSCLREVSAIDD